MRTAGSLHERVAKLSEPELNTGCWLWSGRISTHRGYGLMKVAGRQKRAHRVSWEVHRGAVPPGQVVCHKCDTPACVNPDHLFLGDHAANMLDMRLKGRQSRRVLTEDDVRDIRSRRLSAAAYARHYGVDGKTVRNVLKRRTWTHVA